MKTLTAIFLSSLFLLTACEKDGPAEEFGEQVDEATSDVRGAVEDAADDAGNAIEDACEEVKDAADADNPNC